jgi:hypothetical protein
VLPSYEAWDKVCQIAIKIIIFIGIVYLFALARPDIRANVYILVLLV